ncbi:SH3 domain-containing protein [Neomegalonema perideroedes]|uniref:SH3 domain-containing protein n=1 Tax=Neomegalonema perideroedes TaxID=217219 RepID=UPI00036B685B|nr:SH3 domain-containing protein [Neomegalonema perideroedes]
MKPNRAALLALLGAGLLSFSLAPEASAQQRHDRSGPAYVKEGLSLRAGPGLNHRVVGQLNRGDDFEIRRCVENWCLLAKAGPDGWAPVQALGFGANPFRKQQTHQPHQPAPVQVRPQQHAPVQVQPHQPAPVYVPVPATPSKGPAPIYDPWPARR